MNEVKKPQKPLFYFYGVVLLLIVLFNTLAMPMIARMQVKEVDYGTFMTMTESQEIGRVEIQDNQIIFTDKEDKQVYKTGLMDDPGLVDRLHNSGAVFASEIVEEMSPLLGFFLTWILPMLIFGGIGQAMSKKMMDKAGGGPGAMSFKMGKSNAKVYVKSSDGISFADVEGVDEAEESLAEIVDYLHDPSKYKEIGATMPKGVLLVGH